MPTSHADIAQVNKTTSKTEVFVAPVTFRPKLSTRDCISKEPFKLMIEKVWLVPLLCCVSK